MGIIVDSSVLIAAERGRLDFAAYRARSATEPVFLSAITASELLHGVHRAVTDDQRQRRSAFVEALLARFPILPIDLAVARTHSVLFAALAAAGRTVGAHDLLIAATALAGGHRVLSRDARSFPHIPQLVVELI